jgi:hypothetical protein
LLIGLSFSLMAGLVVIEAIEPWLRRGLLAVVHPILAWLAATASLAHALDTFSPEHLPKTRPLRMVTRPSHPISGDPRAEMPIGVIVVTSTSPVTGIGTKQAPLHQPLVARAPA